MTTFYDLKIARNLNGSRIKWDFGEYIEKELWYIWNQDEIQKIQLLEEHGWFPYEENHPIMKLEMNILPILAMMELEWVHINKSKLVEIWNELSEKITQHEWEIFELVGERFNINSPKQIQYILFEKLNIPHAKKNKTGYSVDNEVLEYIAEKYDIARIILEYRSLSKLKSTYIEWLLKSIHPSTGKIHTNYQQTGTSTGRVSSDNPNLQNIPTGQWYGERIKSCFLPSPGNIFIVADYSQIELRILAHLSKDINLVDAFIQWEDIHTRTARFIFGESTITSEMRRVAKSVNFWVIYGITGFWLSKTIGRSPTEANAYIDTFYKTYPWVRSYYDNILEWAHSNGYVETLFQRRRYIPGINDANKLIRQWAEREAMNMPIQWTAADVLKYAMIAIEKQFKEKKLLSKMILQVHDELVFDVPKEEKTTVETIIRNCMQWVLTGDVPILVDIHHGDNWQDAKG